MSSETLRLFPATQTILVSLHRLHGCSGLCRLQRNNPFQRQEPIQQLHLGLAYQGSIILRIGEAELELPAAIALVWPISSRSEIMQRTHRISQEIRMAALLG